MPGERDEREVGGVEHQLDAHEHDDRVAAHQHADRADREQQRRQVAGSSSGFTDHPVPVPVVLAGSGRCSASATGQAVGHATTRRTCRRAAAPGCRRRCAGRRRRGWAAGSACSPGAEPRRSRQLALASWRRSNRSRCASTIAPSAAVISSALVTSNANTYLVKISAAEPCDVAVRVGRRAQAGERRRPDALPMPAISSTPKPMPDDDRRDALAAHGLDQRVGGVDADEHQHEQEQHHDRAGVDDDLHDAEERRVLGDVEHRQRDHRHRQEHRRVHRLAARHHAERADHRDGAEDPERAPPRRRGATASQRSARESAVVALLARSGARPGHGDVPQVVVLLVLARRASGAAAAPCRAAAGRAACPCS